MRVSLVIVVSTLLVGCGHNGWDRYADSLTTTQPAQQDITGSYVLTRQTITTNGMAVLQGGQCRLDLQLDGSFMVTNYPTWTNGELAGLLSTTGQWHCTTVGFVFNNQNVWGIRFSEADQRMDSLSFTGKAAPYGLLMTYGDPDENAVMIFERKK
jgi:hypothetical protein